MKKQFKAAKNKRLGVHLPSASSCPTLGQSLSLMFYNTLRRAKQRRRCRASGVRVLVFRDKKL
jgi:hypothetical protein